MNKKIIIGIIIAVVVPAVVYAGSPLLINKTIDEALPSTNVGVDTLTSESTGVSVVSGDFVGVGDGIHNANGIAKIISLEDGTKILRLEDFKSTNGPDLYVYLATDPLATDYVSLGPLKANIGNQNYQIPDGTDLSKYDTALIWCRQFSVLFGHANLS
jgi:hypothetical protein